MTSAPHKAPKLWPWPGGLVLMGRSLGSKVAALLAGICPETNGYHATGIFGYGWSYTEILSVTLEVLRPFVTITHRRTSYFFLNQDVPTESYMLSHSTGISDDVESQLARLQCQNLAQRIQGHGGVITALQQENLQLLYRAG